MHLKLVHIYPRPNTHLPFEDEVAHYLKLASRWIPSQSRGFASESAFSVFLDGSRQHPTVVLCDLHGKMFTSEEFAGWIRLKRDTSAAEVILGIGPADGWSAGMLEKADLCLSLGRMTLPHALARLVLAEQIYRVATIVGGHPYHLGH